MKSYLLHDYVLQMILKDQYFCLQQVIEDIRRWRQVKVLQRLSACVPPIKEG